MSDKTYDTLKYVAQIVLPALATLYFALAQIWGLPWAAEIVGTITAIDTFMGVLLRISTNGYNKDMQDPEYLNVKRQQDERIQSGEFEGKDYTGGEK